MAKLVILLLSCMAYVYAEPSLEEQLQELKQSAPNVKFPSVPVYDVTLTNYQNFGFTNYFQSTRLSDTNYTTQLTSDFNLNQLEMVGYMKDNNITYSLIKTPYETLMLKVGDKVKSGNIVSINESGTVIDEIVVDSSGKMYKKVINLKFNTNDDIRLKLQ